MLEIKNLCAGAAQKDILNQLNFEAKPGEVTLLWGLMVRVKVLSICAGRKRRV